MGLALASNVIDKQNNARLMELLQHQLKQLEGQLVCWPNHGNNTHLGAKLDVCLVTQYGYALPNTTHCPDVKLPPISKTHDVFSLFHQRIEQTLRQQRNQAIAEGHDIVAIGALPTQRKFPINGSFVFSQQVSSQDFASYYNAAQLSCCLTLAIAANSPFYLGRPTWEDSRIAQLSPSVKQTPSNDAGQVIFGYDWLKNGVIELYQRNLQRSIEHDVEKSIEARLYTINDIHNLKDTPPAWWFEHNPLSLWNRGTVSFNDHNISIEYGSIPAGPTMADSIANAMLQLGLTLYLTQNIKQITQIMSFAHAKHNFYRCAEFGLDATVFWPDQALSQVTEQPVIYVLADILLNIRQTLRENQFSAYDIEHYIGIIEQRLITRQNGATWQRLQYRRLVTQYNSTKALEIMTRDYMSNAHTGVPVAEWN